MARYAMDAVMFYVAYDKNIKYQALVGVIG